MILDLFCHKVGGILRSGWNGAIVMSGTFRFSMLLAPVRRAFGRASGLDSVLRSGRLPPQRISALSSLRDSVFCKEWDLGCVCGTSRNETTNGESSATVRDCHRLAAGASRSLAPCRFEAVSSFSSLFMFCLLAGFSPSLSLLVSS